MHPTYAGDVTEDTTRANISDELTDIRNAATGIERMQTALKDYTKGSLTRIIPFLAEHVCPDDGTRHNTENALWALLGYPPHPDAR